MLFNQGLPRRRGARVSTALIVAAIFLSAGLGSAQAGDVGKRPPGQFDYYLLSLSSVPGFCATNKKTPGECTKGLTFALHGLWPELTGGDYPTGCSATPLTKADVQAAQDVFADPSMIQHEWSKHGTCSGLQPAAYFALATSQRQHVKVPVAYGPKTVLKLKDAKTIVAAFVAANPGLASQDLAVKGAKGIVTELDVCVTKTGQFRAC